MAQDEARAWGNRMDAGGEEVFMDALNAWVNSKGDVSESYSLSRERADIERKAKADGTWLKAPNGKDTNLTPEQWVTVRTKAFKEWFGDWELAYKKDFLLNGKPVSILNGDEFLAKEVMTFVDQVESFFKEQGGMANSQFGEVLLDRKGAKADKKHGTSRIKSASFAAIKDVLEQGCIILPLRRYNIHDKKQATGMIAAPIEIGGDRYICVVEVIANLQNKRLYVHEAFLTKNLQEVLATSHVRHSDSTTSHKPLGEIAKVLQNVVTAKDSSKIVDENGEPRVMHHGSSWRPLQETDGKAVFNMEDGALGKGAYFTSAFPEAADYARDSLDNWDLSEDEIDDDGYVTDVFLNVRDDAQILRDNAYGNDSFIVVATSPNQIKSATENIGTFDSANDDIRYSLNRDDVTIATPEMEAEANPSTPNTMTEQEVVAENEAKKIINKKDISIEEIKSKSLLFLIKN